jgi:hypothetical protein
MAFFRVRIKVFHDSQEFFSLLCLELPVLPGHNPHTFGKRHSNTDDAYKAAQIFLW